MKLFTRRHDGGSSSGVTGYWLIEIKSLFSIVLLRFSPNNRENYHSHAFNAYTWFIRGSAIEERLHEYDLRRSYKRYTPSIKFKYTPRENIHKIHCIGTVWAISVRGPWSSTWKEINLTKQEILTLTHGRKILRIERIV